MASSNLAKVYKKELIITGFDKESNNFFLLLVNWVKAAIFLFYFCLI